MSTLQKIEVTGLKDVRRRLKRLGKLSDRQKAIKKAGRTAMAPVLQRAKANAPVKKGILRESLAIQTSKSGAYKQAFHVQPRRSFRGDTFAIGDSTKARAAHRRAGKKLHSGVPPHFYAIIVETGRLPSGRPSDRYLGGSLGRRVARANPFLARTYNASKHKVPDHFRNLINQDLDRTLGPHVSPPKK